jgi:hypothetical protein
MAGVVKSVTLNVGATPIVTLAVIMPIGPLAIAIVRGILPYKTTDSNTTLAAQVAAHQGTETLVVWLTFVAMLTLIPGIIAVGLMARSGAPRLGPVRRRPYPRPDPDRHRPVARARPA